MRTHYSQLSLRLAEEKKKELKNNLTTEKLSTKKLFPSPSFFNICIKIYIST